MDLYSEVRTPLLCWKEKAGLWRAEGQQINWPTSLAACSKVAVKDKQGRG